ncbi:GntR family transcriptional regulator [Ramlibacter rhizophilus]|uniref:GntR family transcriptional regulator n=1 Tax=Ramlibacter rhizophilus TaxID=1781167 RepID=A0A4Z0C0L4_9BURK|nr:GntR family transcriptional regulator [Ramlibacter rhizophilus]
MAAADAELPLPRVPGTSLHRQLFLVLRDRIVSGELPTGAALPKEEALCQQFGVSRITVRRALGDLAALGLVERRHGLGTFVRGSGRVARPQPTLSFVDELRRLGAQTEVEVLAFAKEPPPAQVASLLALAAGEPALHALRLRSVKSTPLMLTDAWVPAAAAKGITRAALGKKAMYELLLQHGVRLGRVVQEISAEIASPRLAQALATEPGAPLIRLVRLLHDTQGKPVQHLTVHMSAERSRILMEVKADAVNTLNAGLVVHDALLASGAAPS